MTEVPTYERYTSNELTHFVGRSRKNEDERYCLLKKILRDGRLLANGISESSSDTAALLTITGNKRISDETAIQGQIVCFCDIPSTGLELHMRKYSHFGMAFPKSFLVAKGANPVYYAVRDAIQPGLVLVPSGSGCIDQMDGVTRAELMDQLHAEAMALSTTNHDLMFNSDNPDLRSILFRVENLRRLLYQTVLAFIKPFDSTEAEDSGKNYYMEREWRIYGDITFQESDVHRVILPASHVDAFHRDFPDFTGELYVPTGAP